MFLPSAHHPPAGGAESGEEAAATGSSVPDPHQGGVPHWWQTTPRQQPGVPWTASPTRVRLLISVNLSFVSDKCAFAWWEMFSHHRCMSLSDNENTGFKARELKSGHVDAVGTYLRITFHTNHINCYNKYNQVKGFSFLEPTSRLL